MEVLIEVLEGFSEYKPKKMHEGDAGFDCYSCENATLNPGDITVVRLGFRLKLPKGHEAQIRSRSGLAAKGIVVANSPGTVDSNYTGEVKAILCNIGKNTEKISIGDRVCQMVINKLPDVELIEGKVKENDERGSDGFGSSGIR